MINALTSSSGLLDPDSSQLVESSLAKPLREGCNRIDGQSLHQLAMTRPSISRGTLNTQ